MHISRVLKVAITTNFALLIFHKTVPAVLNSRNCFNELISLLLNYMSPLFAFKQVKKKSLMSIKPKKVAPEFKVPPFITLIND